LDVSATPEVPGSGDDSATHTDYMVYADTQDDVEEQVWEAIMEKHGQEINEKLANEKINEGEGDLL
jgi:hypothetical protein